MYLDKPLRLWVSIVLLVFCSSLGAQIVNIESRRTATDTSGWYGSVHADFNGSKTTRSTLAIFAGGDLQFKSDSGLNYWLFLSDFSLISGDNEKFSNAGFGHIRYNRKLNETIRWEVFTQIQYNGLTKIDTRALVGTGPRIKLTQFEDAKFYLGVAYMYEYQELLDPIVYQRHHRASSYFTFTLTPEEAVTFISTIYAQPLLSDFSDYRIMTETNLTLDITKKLSFNVTFHYNFNAAPPAGVPTNTYYFRNGLRLSF